jgi:Domain of unknown function (DUF4350)
MRQKLGLIVTVVVVVGILVVINSLTYVSQESKKDSELAPNRSTYHSGPTGTRALYDLLNESGFRVIRWREVPEKLLGTSQKVQTFVIVGLTKLPIEEQEADSLLLWVERGGRLVLVDRRPENRLLPASGKWQVRTELQALPSFDTDPGNTESMTNNVGTVSPAQPTLLTWGVDTVQPSSFAATVSFGPSQHSAQASQEEGGLHAEDEFEEDASPSPDVNKNQEGQAQSPAPVVHLSNTRGPLLVDYQYGAGRIVVLSEPYLFSNAGIGLKDNVQLAINVVGSGGGLIAFDEFHQGRGTTGNPLFTYFAGTPIIALCAQLILLILLVVWTRGRRFARAMPLPAVDRRSTLEFVVSMAEVQQRAHAYDLAIENIYSRTRRVLARYAGLEYNSPRSEIAARVASRSSIDAKQLETLMRQCEEAINGQPINERRSIQLVKRLREIESKLGLRMRSREVKQAAQNI